MKLAQFESYQRAQRSFVMRGHMLLLALAVLILGLFMWSGRTLSPQELALMQRIRAAQEMLYDWRMSGGSELDPLDDPYKTGFIGLEWSELSTTVGLLSAKRTACDPRWAVIVRRWMESLQIKDGDSVAVFSSSSFPGMAFNVIAALESMKVNPILVVSLGSSVWGANETLFPWPAIETKLRSMGCIKSKSLFYTLGGNRENGGGLSDEARSILTKAADSAAVPLVHKDSLEEVIQWKMDLLKEYHVKALISIGGSAANLGHDQAIFRLAPGLHLSGDGGDGVIGRALKAGYPVAHLLNIKGLSARYGVPFDAAPGFLLYGRRAVAAAIIGLLLFAVVMYRFNRWKVL